MLSGEHLLIKLPTNCLLGLLDPECKGSQLRNVDICLSVDTAELRRRFHSSSYYNDGHAVAQLVEALHYKLECRGFDSR